jgi:hypothetical protein
VESLPDWLKAAWQAVLTVLPLVLFFLFFLFAVNWRRLGEVLREGGAVPLALLLVLIAFVWSQIAPSEAELLRGLAVGNFWWQLLTVGFWASVALFAGWLQDRYGWYPPEYAVEPPAVHGHGTEHHPHGESHHPHIEHNGRHDTHAGESPSP